MTTTTTPLTILGLSGSLRAASYNTALLRAAGQLLPPDARFVLHDLSDVPLYNPDHAKSPAVERLEQAILTADALLIASPEYNYGMTGVLKNAIDAASRPAYASVFAGKPVALIGATGSLVGTARAQAQLKNVMLGMLAEVFPWPEVLVSSASTRFTDGELTDEKTREVLATMLAAFVTWIRRSRPA